MTSGTINLCDEAIERPRVSAVGPASPGAFGRLPSGVAPSDIFALTYEMEETFWWYKARRRIILDRLAGLTAARRRQHLPPARILDFGCGTGLNLQCFDALGDAVGVDVSPRAVGYCRQRGLSNVRCTDTVDDMDLPESFHPPFDVVTLLDVLEHIEDQPKVLGDIHRWLRPGGTLIVSVPAYEFLWRGEDHVSGHHRRYTRRSLSRVLRACGFEMDRVTYFNTFLFPAQVLAILGNRLLRPRRMYETDIRPVPALANRVLERVMAAESPLLNWINLPVGGSILGIARVPDGQVNNA